MVSLFTRPTYRLGGPRHTLRLRSRRRIEKAERNVRLQRELGWFATQTAGIGPPLADLARHECPDLVVAPQSRGTLLGSLVATSLGVGLSELHKEVSAV